MLKQAIVATLLAGTLLACAEALLRGVLGVGTPPLSTYDPHYEYGYLPNQHLQWLGNRIDYDGDGLRSDRNNPRLMAFSPRVLFVGGSVADGGVLTLQEDTVAESAGRWLARRNLRIVPMSAAADGWALENAMAFLEKRGVFAARALVVQISSQDLWKRRTRYEEAVRDGLAQTVEPQWAMGEFARRFLFARWLTPERARGEGLAEDRRACLATLRRIIQIGRGHGCQVFVLLTPERRELRESKSYDQTMGDVAAVVSAERAVRVGTLHALQSSGLSPSALYRDEIHPTNRGSRLIGETMAAVMAQWMAGLL